MKKILIVDADEQVRSILDLKLQQARYEVRTLASTMNALSLVRDFMPDLIVSEMVLPELSGVDFLKRVRMNPESASTPFIFLSSSRNVEDKIIAHEMGAEAFFVKPVFIKALINRINDLFEQSAFNAILASNEDDREFKGELSNISLIDLCNIIRENKKTGQVEIKGASGEKARIYFGDGDIRRIEKDGADNSNGERLLFALLSWNEGVFTISYAPYADITPNVDSSTERLVVNAVSWMKEYTSELSGFPPLDVPVYLDFGYFLSILSKLPDDLNAVVRVIAPEGTRVGDVLERTNQDKKKAVEYLKKLIELKVVVFERKETPFTAPEVPLWLAPVPAQEVKIAPQPEPEQKTAAEPVPAPTPEVKPEPAPIQERKPESLQVSAPLTQPAATSAPVRPIEKPEPLPAVPTNTEIQKVEKHEQKKDIEQADESFVSDLYEAEKDAPKSSKKFLAVLLLLVVIGGAAFTAYYFGLFNKNQTAAQQVPVVPDSVLKPEPKPEPQPAPDQSAVRDAGIAPIETGLPKPQGESPFDNELLKKNAEELNVMGSAALKEEKFGDAVKFYRFAIEKASGQQGNDELLKLLWKNIAIAHYSAEDYDSALPAAEKALMLSFSDDRVELKAAILEEMKRYDDAIKTYIEGKAGKGITKTKISEWNTEIKRLKKLAKTQGGSE